MRNYKFKLSAMIPSEWFHKLKNMTKSRKKHHLPSSLESKTLQISSRNSLHKIQSKRRTLYKPSPPSSSSISAGFNKKKIKFLPIQDSFSASFDDQLGLSSHSSNLKLSSSADDIIIDMKNRDFKKKMFKEIKVFDSTEKACPASNRTKKTLKTHHLSVKVNNKLKEEEEDVCRIQKKYKKKLVSSGRRSSANSPRIKLRVTSPRVQASPSRSKSRLQRTKVLDSFAVVKSSLDPEKDFRESMVEMIAENNIRNSKDLEDLLACYLSLNPMEYHNLIVKVFVQLWLEVISPRRLCCCYGEEEDEDEDHCFAAVSHCPSPTSTIYTVSTTVQTFLHNSSTFNIQPQTKTLNGTTKSIWIQDICIHQPASCLLQARMLFVRF